MHGAAASGVGWIEHPARRRRRRQACEKAFRRRPRSKRAPARPGLGPPGGNGAKAAAASTPSDQQPNRPFEAPPDAARAHPTSALDDPHSGSYEAVRPSDITAPPSPSPDEQQLPRLPFPTPLPFSSAPLQSVRSPSASGEGIQPRLCGMPSAAAAQHDFLGEQSTQIAALLSNAVGRRRADQQAQRPGDCRQSSVSG